MSEFLFKIKIVIVLCTAITISSVSFISAANSAGMKKPSVKQIENQLTQPAKQQNRNSKKYNWGHACNDYGPVGSVNFHTTFGKKGPVDRAACELAKKKMIRK